MARPKKHIDKKQFEAMCGIQCTLEEICIVFGVTDKTLNRWCKEKYGYSFSEVFQEKRMAGRASLRRMQWEQAKKSTTMSIWLGKQYLGQVDDREGLNIRKEQLELSKRDLEFKLSQAEKGLGKDGEDILLSMVEALKRNKEDIPVIAAEEEGNENGV